MMRSTLCLLPAVVLSGMASAADIAFTWTSTDAATGSGTLTTIVTTPDGPATLTGVMPAPTLVQNGSTSIPLPSGIVGYADSVNAPQPGPAGTEGFHLAWSGTATLTGAAGRKTYALDLPLAMDAVDASSSTGDGWSYSFSLFDDNGVSSDVSGDVRIAGYLGPNSTAQRYSTGAGELVFAAGADSLTAARTSPGVSDEADGNFGLGFSIYSIDGSTSGGLDANSAIFVDELTFSGTLRNRDESGLQVTAEVPFVLEIRQIGGALEFEWKSLSGKYYSLVSSLDLSTPMENWLPYSNGTITYEDIEGSGGPVVLTEVPYDGARRFFALVERAEASQPAAQRGLVYYRETDPGPPRTIEADLAVYGGTPGGVSAALAAARAGKRVLLLSFNQFVGGLPSGGLTYTDLGNPSSIGGIAEEFFYSRLSIPRGFSPAEAEAQLLQMLDEAGVTVFLERCLSSVQFDQGAIISITMETGETIEADVFIDGTYEGDLLAAAGVSYRVGREPTGAYGESLAGRWNSGSEFQDVYQFCRRAISPYVVAGDPSSGLLPEIQEEPRGNTGDGDYAVQAYNFRVHMTDQTDKVPFPQPPGYDAGRYGLLARFLNFDPTITWTLTYTRDPNSDGPVQMRATDSNSAGSFSTDYVGGNYRWPDGTYDTSAFSVLPPPRQGLPVPLDQLYDIREAIFQDHVGYQQGLYYFLANDPQVPTELQDRVNAFGLEPDEFQSTGNWPHQLYVREGRRMVSDYVMTQGNCQGSQTATDSIGLASYQMDSHFCRRTVVEEGGVMTVRNDGGLGEPSSTYPIAYRSIVPTETECTNLLVPVCLSASHVAFGSIRMEPVFMILGQSAGTAAVLAIDGDIPVQDVDYTTLRNLLIADGQEL